MLGFKMLKKIKIFLLSLLFITATSLVFKYTKEVFFLFYAFSKTEYIEGKDFCITEDNLNKLSVYSDCKVKEKYNNVILLHGWSPKGNKHPDLIKFIGLLIKTEKNFRIFVPYLKSLTSPEWQFGETKKELSVINRILSSNNIQKYRIISICGSTQALINVLEENKLPIEPEKVFLWNPYYSISSLLESYNTTTEGFEKDIYVQSIIYLNTASVREENRKRIIKFFENSKPGKTSRNDVINLLGEYYSVIESYTVSDKTIQYLSQFNPKIKKAETKYIIINSKNDSFIPSAESMKLSKALIAADNNVEVYISGENHGFQVEIKQAFKLLDRLLN